MSGISINENEALISVDTRFYGYLSVVVAAAEYTEHFWVQMDGDPQKSLTIRLMAKSDDLDLEAGAHEFFNYLLSLMEESRKVLESTVLAPA